MMKNVNILFASGEEQDIEGETAEVTDNIFVVYKRVRRNGRSKLESTDCFPANEVVRAILPDGGIRLGRATS